MVVVLVERIHSNHPTLFVEEVNKRQLDVVQDAPHLSPDLQQAHMEYGSGDVGFGKWHGRHLVDVQVFAQRIPPSRFIDTEFQQPVRLVGEEGADRVSVPSIDSQIPFLVADSFVGAVDHSVADPRSVHVVFGDRAQPLVVVGSRGEDEFGGGIHGRHLLIYQRPWVVFERVVA